MVRLPLFESCRINGTSIQDSWAPVRRGRSADTVMDSRRKSALAEGEGFEPPKACTLVVFKTTAIDHSAIPPAIINNTVAVTQPSYASKL